ncbi:GNAT family N-acetyltransferase [Seonamhaeicola algicola]|uniref:GNAT family N-acetyltransferase n=1 Tax=Seonamhaeicola algicola TaxID=1719036 RepID=A0A5C7AYV0_9FLAO|nr:GNAT family N-acetyltransferase [Seonamhaeicola algicola]TXE11675.1 GNAT family N-acetyltransferase [Seonamhaeicola algicola]
MLPQHTKLDIITEKNAWDRILKNIQTYDVYHTYNYHHATKHEAHQAVLLVYTTNTSTIALPLLLRPIEGTPYFDATSVYGYVGPLASGNLQPDTLKDFKQLLQAFFEKKHIVSVFSRLHPFVAQTAMLDGMGTTTHIGNVVNIDITLPVDTQRTLFSKTTKRYLNKCYKQFHVKTGKTAADIAAFMALYYENMDRVQATKAYYFSEAYFQKLLESTDFDTQLLMAIDNTTNTVAAAALMIQTNTIVQYHLSGTNAAYLHLSPIRLLIDTMRIKATEAQCTHFNLGGGLGGSSDDALFNFKASFSKDFKAFKVWKYIVNTEVYNALVTQNNIQETNDDTYFPLYRKHEAD